MSSAQVSLMLVGRMAMIIKHSVRSRVLRHNHCVLARSNRRPLQFLLDSAVSADWWQGSID
jgi:hypothetical protein